MQKRLLLFDIDGTLIHSGGAGVEALKLALTERFGIKDDLHDIEIAGMTDSGIVISILRSHKIPTTAENIAAFSIATSISFRSNYPAAKENFFPACSSCSND